MNGLLNKRVLVLNQNYLPLTITKTKRAISLILDKKVEILEKYNDEIHSVNLVLYLPSVIRLTRYISYQPKAIPLTRKNLLRKSNSQIHGSALNIQLNQSNISLGSANLAFQASHKMNSKNYKS